MTSLIDDKCYYFIIPAMFIENITSYQIIILRVPINHHVQFHLYIVLYVYVYTCMY